MADGTVSCTACLQGRDGGCIDGRVPRCAHQSSEAAPASFASSESQTGCLLTCHLLCVLGVREG